MCHNTSWENIFICKNFLLSSFCFKLSMCMRFLWSGSLHSTFLNSAESASHRLYILHQLSCLLLCAKFLSLPPLTWDAFSKHYYFSGVYFLTKALLVYCILAYQWYAESREAQTVKFPKGCWDILFLLNSCLSFALPIKMCSFMFFLI